MADKTLADKAIDIKWKEYVQVKDRVQFLSDNYEGRYSINSDYDYYPERKLWVVKSTLTIWDENHENPCVYTGLAQEIESDNYKQVNFSSALENCETSSVWRCCAFAGIWVLNWGIASSDEMQKAFNRQKAMEAVIADTPFTDGPSNPEPDRFEKAKQWIKFMQQCLDEEDFIKKVKARVSEIGAKMTKQQETDLRLCYKNAKAMENLPTEVLPFE